MIDDAIEAGLAGSHPVTADAQMRHLELPKVTADLERELATVSLDCRDCGEGRSHIAGLGVEVGIGRTRGGLRTADDPGDCDFAYEWLALA